MSQYYHDFTQIEYIIVLIHIELVIIMQPRLITQNIVNKNVFFPCKN